MEPGNLPHGAAASSDAAPAQTDAESVDLGTEDAPSTSLLHLPDLALLLVRLTAIASAHHVKLPTRHACESMMLLRRLDA